MYFCIRGNTIDSQAITLKMQVLLQRLQISKLLLRSLVHSKSELQTTSNQNLGIQSEILLSFLVSFRYDVLSNISTTSKPIRFLVRDFNREFLLKSHN